MMATSRPHQTAGKSVLGSGRVPTHALLTAQDVSDQQRRQAAMQQLPVLQNPPPKGVACRWCVGDAQQVAPIDCRQEERAAAAAIEWGERVAGATPPRGVPVLRRGAAGNSTGLCCSAVHSLTREEI